MHSDLEFEYPHKLEKIAVKADVLKMIEEEEDKLIECYHYVEW